MQNNKVKALLLLDFKILFTGTVKNATHNLEFFITLEVHIGSFIFALVLIISLQLYMTVLKMSNNDYLSIFRNIIIVKCVFHTNSISVSQPVFVNQLLVL